MTLQEKLNNYNPSVVDQWRDHLILLARYLYRLPSDYCNFNMKHYYGVQDSSIDCHTFFSKIFIESVNTFPDCGTVACAIGHTPFALKSQNCPVNLIDYDSDEVYGWADYTCDVFGAFVFDEVDHTNLRNEYWFFMFDSEWTHIDNTAVGAAQRITYVLTQYQLPDSWGYGTLYFDQPTVDLYKHLSIQDLPKLSTEPSEGPICEIKL